MLSFHFILEANLNVLFRVRRNLVGFRFVRLSRSEARTRLQEVVSDSMGLG
jgi:hypothetical protein